MSSFLHVCNVHVCMGDDDIACCSTVQHKPLVVEN